MSFKPSTMIHSLALPLAATVAAVVSIYLFRSDNMKRNLNKYLQLNMEFECFPAKETFPTSRTILMTGGNGFLGGYILSLLLEKKINVIIFDIVLPPIDKRNPHVAYVKGNILKLDHVQKAFNLYKDIMNNITWKVHSVIHTASLIPYLGVPNEAVWSVNVEGTKNILKVAKEMGVVSLIYTSSATVVLEKNFKVAEKLTEDAPMPDQHLDTYTTTKHACETEVLSANDTKTLATCVLRPSGIFGRGDKLVADKRLAGQDNVVLGKNNLNKIDWVHVKDVANAHVLAEEALFSSFNRSTVAGQAYFIGGNESQMYAWFMGFGSKGSKPGLSHWESPHPDELPFPIASFLSHVNIGVYNLLGVIPLSPFLSPSLLTYTQRTYTFSSAKAQKDFGYAPKTTITEAIQQLVKEYQDEKKK